MNINIIGITPEVVEELEKHLEVKPMKSIFNQYQELIDITYQTGTGIVVSFNDEIMTIANEANLSQMILYSSDFVKVEVL